MPWFLFYGLAMGFAMGPIIHASIGAISAQTMAHDVLLAWQYLCVTQLTLILVLSLMQALT